MPALNKKTYFIAGFLLLILVFAALAIFFYLQTKVKETPQTITNTPVQQKELPAEVLEAEKLPQYENETSNFSASDVDGTPDKSMFADVQEPKFLPISQEKILKDTDVVASFHIGNDYRAYPLKYIYYHHLVNDKFGDQPVLISYCGICNSAAAYDPVIDGKTHSFGVLGVLLHNDLVMYDRETDSWWVQITGQAFSGKYDGKKLKLLPGLELVPYLKFKSAHPNGKVLQPDPKYNAFYEEFAQYTESKEDSGNPGDPAEFDQVVGIAVRGKAKAYKVADIKSEKIVNDTLNGWSLLVVSDPKDGGVRIFRRFLDSKALEFELIDGKLVDKQTGSTWSFNGGATGGQLQGESLTSPEYLELYFFAWQGFYPKTDIYQPTKTN